RLAERAWPGIGPAAGATHRQGQGEVTEAVLVRSSAFRRLPSKPPEGGTTNQAPEPGGRERCLVRGRSPSCCYAGNSCAVPARPFLSRNSAATAPTSPSKSDARSAVLKRCVICSTRLPLPPAGRC